MGMKQRIVLAFCFSVGMLPIGFATPLQAESTPVDGSSSTVPAAVQQADCEPPVVFEPADAALSCRNEEQPLGEDALINPQDPFWASCSGDQCGCYDPPCSEECAVGDTACFASCRQGQKRCAICCCCFDCQWYC